MKTQQELTDYINEAIASIPYPQQPAGLYEPIAYTLSSGGKRLRPTLLLSVMEALGGKASDAVNQAMGIEMYHDFTLVHDDVMVNAEDSAVRAKRQALLKRLNVLMNSVAELSHLAN